MTLRLQNGSEVDVCAGAVQLPHRLLGKENQNPRETRPGLPEIVGDDDDVDASDHCREPSPPTACTSTAAVAGNSPDATTHSRHPNIEPPIAGAADATTFSAREDVMRPAGNAADGTTSSAWQEILITPQQHEKVGMLRPYQCRAPSLAPDEPECMETETTARPSSREVSTDTDSTASEYSVDTEFNNNDYE